MPHLSRSILHKKGLVFFVEACNYTQLEKKSGPYPSFQESLKNSINITKWTQKRGRPFLLVLPLYIFGTLSGTFTKTQNLVHKGLYGFGTLPTPYTRSLLLFLR